MDNLINPSPVLHERKSIGRNKVQGVPASVPIVPSRQQFFLHADKAGVKRRIRERTHRHS